MGRLLPVDHDQRAPRPYRWWRRQHGRRRGRRKRRRRSGLGALAPKPGALGRQLVQVVASKDQVLVLVVVQTGDEGGEHVWCVAQTFEET
ncbi:MAG TPA: hypothetical protein VLR88_06590, partial [Propionibacteriaceae bacterium]|nr:hypothetical protein [Propionibacteriaceae bacterium]